MTFLQSVFTDGGDPGPSMLSSPIIISLVNDDIFEDVEFFKARIVVTSDRLRVRIGSQDAIKVFITDDDCELENYSIRSVCLESECLRLCRAEVTNFDWRSQIVLSIIIMLACNLIAHCNSCCNQSVVHACTAVSLWIFPLPPVCSIHSFISQTEYCYI